MSMKLDLLKKDFFNTTMEGQFTYTYAYVSGTESGIAKVQKPALFKLWYFESCKPIQSLCLYLCPHRITNLNNPQLD